MTRNEAAEYGAFIGLKPSTYAEEVIMIDTILALKQFETCGNCQYYWSTTDCLIKTTLKEKALSYFGCNEFKPCK